MSALRWITSSTSNGSQTLARKNVTAPFALEFVLELSTLDLDRALALVVEDALVGLPLAGEIVERAKVGAGTEGRLGGPASVSVG